MSKDIFGLTKVGFKKKIESEKKKISEIQSVFIEITNQIKYTAEPDGWQRLIIFSENNYFFNDFSYAQRSMILYYLRRHQNIISKLSDREKKHVSDAMKPYLFKWVTAEEKTDLKMEAIYFRNVPKNIQEYIFNNLPNENLDFFIDVLSVFEFLCGKKKQDWIEISISNISTFSGVPVENTRFALNVLLKLKLIVFAYVPCEQRKDRKKLNIKITLSDEEYEKAVTGANINADFIVKFDDVTDENFNFTTVDYFYNLVNNLQNPDLNLVNDSKISDTNLVPENFKAGKTIPPVNIVIPAVEELHETLKSVQECVTSFTETATKILDHSVQKNESVDGLLQTISEQRSDYDELYKNTLEMKKLLNKQNRDKLKFVKGIQDSLNMMMGQMITETDVFAKIPRHKLDEVEIQKHKATIIKIAVQTAEEIRMWAVKNFDDK